MDESVNALIQVRFDGGIYNLKRISLAPYQTMALNIRELRDSQQKDVRENLMPRDAEAGQVVWFEEKKGSMIGRAEVFNSQLGIASSFSCTTNCFCPPVFYQSYMSPSSIVSAVGDLGQPFLALEERIDCNLIIYGPIDRSGDFGTDWSSTNPSVASVSNNPPGQVSCLAPGTATIRASFNGPNYDESCNFSSVPTQPPGGVQVVTCTVTIQAETISPGDGTLPVRNPAKIRRTFAPVFEATLPAPSCPVTWSIVSGSGSIVGSTTSRLVTVNGNAIGTIMLRATTTGGSLADISVPVVNEMTVNVRVWIVRRTDGTHAATTTTRVNNDIGTANNIWVQCGIKFNLVSTSFINNTTYLTPNAADRALLRNTNMGTDGIEIYYVDSFSDTTDTGLTTNDGVVISDGGNGRTAAHELGHAMGLPDSGTVDLHLMSGVFSALKADIRLSECDGLTRFTSN